MKTLLQGGWVVAFNGEAHEVYDNGTVVYEDDRIIHAGGPTPALSTPVSMPWENYLAGIYQHTCASIGQCGGLLA